MNPSGNSPAAGLTPGKLVLIAGLAVVLAVILLVQFSGEAEGIAIRVRKLDGGAATQVAGIAPPSESAAPARPRWQPIPREVVAAFNPFRIPESLRARPETPPDSAQPATSGQLTQPVSSSSLDPLEAMTTHPTLKEEDAEARIRAAERKSRIEKIRTTASDLQRRGVGVVVATSAGAVARIGEEEVRVGDVINDVLRIVAIGPQGIVVEEVLEEETHRAEPRP